LLDDDPQLLEKKKGMRLIREIRLLADAEDEELETRSWLWFERPGNADNEGSKSASKPVSWQVHTDDVTENATRIVAGLKLPEEVQAAVKLAAKFHDRGKKRELWQRSIGNPNPRNCLAKSGGRMRPLDLTDYRHEFGSLLDIQQDDEFKSLKEMPELQELVLHLIAVHHGFARPHFPPDNAFDPEPKGMNVEQIAAEVPQRFARLQRKYGRWGLAYLESLLRAADYAASAAPSAFVEDQP
jgi:CRISPR-associated endonuclease/helicase Cas3